MKHFEDLINLYSVQKTICMQLIPEKKTLDNFITSGLLEEDLHRAESYKKVKKIIDGYHKVYIDRILTDFKLKLSDNKVNDSLSEYFLYYNIRNRDDVQKERFSKIKSNLRKQISDALKQDEAYKRIFKKELIREDLIDFVNTIEDRLLIEEFKDFTTYFTGFNENRANMYKDDEVSTSISYRLINENLPKFIDNINVFDKISIIPEINEKINTLYKEFEPLLNVESIKEMFTLSYFNIVLTQKQIEVYNSVIGGKSCDNKKIQGLNEFINLYNQNHKESRLPKFKFLFKQILSDRDSISWLPEKFNSDHEALSSIKECYDTLCETVLGESNLKNLLLSLKDYSINEIYIKNDLQLTDISQKMFGSWSIIQNAIIQRLSVEVQPKKKESLADYEARLINTYKKIDSFSIGYIDDSLKQAGYDKSVEDYYVNLGALNNEKEQRENLFSLIENAYTDVSKLLVNHYPDNRNLSQDKESVTKIKNLLDSIKSLQHFIKPLLGKGDESIKDERFYGEFSSLWDELDKITPLYNMVRNYMTRKPYSQEKIKLNFGNSTLMDGWDLNKEHDNTTVLLRRNGIYYLGIMNKKYNKILDQHNIKTDGECYEKMIYKLLPGPNKMLPKVFFAKSRINYFSPEESIVKNYQNQTHIKGDNFNINDCHALIDYFKSSIDKHEDWKNFNFKFSETATYEDLSSFYREVEHQGYNISFTNVSVSYIDKLVEEGQLYLFKIYNKDFSSYSKGTPNLHTLYWKMLFDSENLKNVVYKLNGNGEVFFRKNSLTYDRPTHKANIPIKNKNIENEKSESVFKYDLIKDRRYTVDHFELHVPITMNFKSEGFNNINEYVNEYIKYSDDIHIIGIDRGERHLLYISVIDRFGKIKKQYSLNEIVNEYNGNTYRTNYHDLLDQREADRKKSRQSWESIENIKELKEGYLSQVIHKISQLMIEYHAIVVLEDLNLGFMRGRQKIEKQVYQKFEKKLIDKLNYLVDKHVSPNCHSGLLKAYQFTNKFESFQKLGKQSGFLFYIPAWNTSKIDPVTGFINLFNFQYESVEKAKLLFSKFDLIRYNRGLNLFEFAFDYDKFGAKAEGTRTKWTAYSKGTRVITYRNLEKNSQWDSKQIDLTSEFIKLFSEYDIDINENIKDLISKQTEKSFFEKLLQLFKLTFQMRNSITGTDVDYLISPVPNENGNFYDSRSCEKSLPNNADANGAYNIARKGLMLVKQIKESHEVRKIKFDVSNKSWLNFAQEWPYQEEYE